MNRFRRIAQNAFAGFCFATLVGTALGDAPTQDNPKPAPVRPVRPSAVAPPPQSQVIAATMTLSGEIQLDNLSVPFRNGTVIIEVKDDTLQDLPSKTLSKQVIRNVNSGKKLPFKVTLKNPKKDRIYTVWVHVDLDGDGKLSVGDYYPPRSQGLIVYGKVTKPISVELERIN